MQTLHAGTLVLEPLEPAHADAMYELLRDPALYCHLDHPPPASADLLRERYRRLQARRSPDGTQHWLNWVIRTPGQNLAGYVQATVGPGGDAWVAYVLGRAHWGRGVATQSTRAMLEHLASHYGVRRFLACVEQDNRASIALLGRLGFRAASADEAAPHGLSAMERLFVGAP